MNKKSNKYFVLFICLALVIATLAAFQQVRGLDFLTFDDDVYVTDNSHVKAGLTKESIVWAFTTGHANFWHPLTWLSFMLDSQLFGTGPAGYHLTNLVLHIINTLLLFLVLKKITGGLWQSAFVAALFALHPFHVESVAWISQRKDVLSTLFWTLTMAAYFGYVRRNSTGWYLLTLLVFAMGLMAKPMLVTLPFVLLLLDYWPFGRVESRNLRRLIFEKVTFIVLSVIASVIAFFAQQEGGALREFGALSLKLRIGNAFVSYVKYIQKTLWPVNFSVFYPHPGDIGRLSMSKAGLAALLLIAITALVIWQGRRRKYLVVGWLWYLGTLMPVIGLIQVGGFAMADRYNYVPLTGLFIIAAWGIGELTGKLAYRKIILSISAFVILGALSICSYAQTGYWQNDKTLFGHAIEAAGESYLSNYYLAAALEKEGRVDEAIENYEKVLELYPQCVVAHNNLALLLQAEGKLEQAIWHLQRVIKLKPNSPLAYYNLGNILQNNGRIDEAINYYRQTIRIDPNYVEAYNNLGSLLKNRGKFKEAMSCYRRALSVKPYNAGVYNNIGVLYKAQAEWDKAISYFNLALKYQPNMAIAHFNLGSALAGKGELDKAAKCFHRAVQLKPDYAKAYNNLGKVLVSQGKAGEAIGYYRRATALEPVWVEPMNNLAWLLATSNSANIRNPQQAIGLAEQACELTGYRDAGALDTLAAAYAAAGEFELAIETSEKALELIRSAGRKEMVEEIQSRLRLYKAGLAYIEDTQ